jgi:hypothetical protein
MRFESFPFFFSVHIPLVDPGDHSFVKHRGFLASGAAGGRRRR